MKPLAILTATFGLSLSLSSEVSAASKPVTAPFATPVGIRLEPLGLAAGYSLSKPSAVAVREKIVYADARGLTLYTSDADPVGKSVCVDECAKTWSPALTVKSAAPTGPWSIITRADGTKQWVYNGKPAYTYNKDEDPGSVAGNSPKRFGRGPKIGPRGIQSADIPKDQPLPAGWNVLYHYPSPQGAGIPPVFSIVEVQDANGLVLANQAGLTLYVGDASNGNRDAQCTGLRCKWAPAVAPQLAEASGDFGFIKRADGLRQWTFKGQGLSTYALDLSLGDANGVGVNKNIEVAYVSRYFVPAGVTVQTNPRLGKIWANTKGLTLYRRSAYITQTGAGHGMRHGDAVRPAVGRELATDPRCGECQKQWHPFLASAGAVASGNWEVMTRADGKKQWAYSGFALWTYDGDQKSGDITGNDEYQYTMSHDPTVLADIGTPQDGPGALYWIAAHP